MVLRADADNRRDVDVASACHADALSKVYGADDTAVHALRDVTLDIPRRSFTAIMGPSGSGKSTLLHCLAALDTPTSGRVFLGDTELTALSRRRQARVRRDRIGFVFQAYNLVPTLDALENITLPQLLAGRTPDREWLDHVISRMGLGDRIHHRPNELSGGQQQRIALARALAGRPEVIFADEPTGNLDTATSGEMLTLLRDAVDQFDQTVVTVTHDPSIARYADQILQFSDGRVVGRHDRRAIGEGSTPRHDSDVAGSGGPYHRGPADTPPRSDGQHTMRSRRRRQPDEPTPGRPMVGSDDEVEVARQERWLQRIREQFEAEGDGYPAFDEDPPHLGRRWEDPPADTPAAVDPRPHDGHPHAPEMRRADDGPYGHDRPYGTADGHAPPGTYEAAVDETRRSFHTPPPPAPAPHHANGSAANGHHPSTVARGWDGAPDAAPGPAGPSWDDRFADTAMPSRNGTADENHHAGTWGGADRAEPTDTDWLPPMRSWPDDQHVDDDTYDGDRSGQHHGEAADDRTYDTLRHDEPDRLAPPTDDHWHHPDPHHHQTTRHTEHTEHTEHTDDHWHHPDPHQDQATRDTEHTDDGWLRDQRDAKLAEARGAEHDAQLDTPQQPAPHTASDGADAPWSRPGTGSREPAGRSASQGSWPDGEVDDPWAPADARGAERYRTEQGGGRRGGGWDHDSGDLWATARFDRDDLNVPSDASHEPTTNDDRSGPAAFSAGPHDTADDNQGPRSADHPADAHGADSFAEGVHDAPPALADHPAEPVDHPLPALAAPTYGPPAELAGSNGGGTTEPDGTIDDRSVAGAGARDARRAGAPADEAPTTRGVPTADDDDGAHSAWGTGAQAALDEVWTPTFGRARSASRDGDTGDVQPVGASSDASRDGWPAGSAHGPYDLPDAAPHADRWDAERRDPDAPEPDTHDTPDAPQPHAHDTPDAPQPDTHNTPDAPQPHAHDTPDAPEPDTHDTPDAPEPHAHDTHQAEPAQRIDEVDPTYGPSADEADVAPRRDWHAGEGPVASTRYGTSDERPRRAERPAARVDEPAVPAPLASLRNTRRADQAEDARAALESLQQQLDRLAARAGRGGGPRRRPSAPRGTDRRAPG